MYRKTDTEVQIPLLLWATRVPIAGRADASENTRAVLIYLAVHAETIGTPGLIKGARMRDMVRELRISRRTAYRSLERLQEQELI